MFSTVYVHTQDFQLKAMHHHGNCSVLAERIREYEERRRECLEFENDILGDAVIKSSPYLYPFVIEFALIGASVMFVMWRHVGKV